MTVLKRIDYEQKSDGELVELTLRNQEVFAYLIHRYEDKLFRYIRRISGLRKEDIEDLLQEIFIKVYQNLNGFDRNLKFSSWIYRIAHNQVISNYRKFKNKQCDYIEDNYAIEQKIIYDFDIAKAIELKDLTKEVNSVLKKMDEKYREVLVLKYWEDQDYKEIADILCKPMGTIATLLNRAKKQFKAEINKKIGFPPSRE